MYTSRSRGFGALLSLGLLVAACGGSPEVSNGPSGLGGDVSSNPAGGSDQGTAGSFQGNGGNTSLILPDGGNGAATGEAGDTSQAGATNSGPVCGDGVIDPPETCDDGNSIPGDGCDGNCQKEPNFDCPTPGQKCTPVTTPAVCGNGKIESGETCDLGTGNNDGTKGCDSTCQQVNGWTCPADGSACTRNAFCGDGKVQTTLGEQCDDGTNDGTHGCSTTCTIISGYNCPPTGGACSLAVYCGNGVVDPGEQCDDHNRRSYDGCSATCLIESGFTCPTTGGACMRTCGNSVLDAGETCDDGNFIAGDGCSSTCQLEPNYTCSTVGQPCLFTPPPPPAVCGNGKIETGETCDDGNATGGDGCSATCTTEAGWNCSTPGMACKSVCGDGILVGTEACDDHNLVAGDGCSPTCTVETGAICPANGGACVPQKCGDGKVTGSETCDDGKNDGLHGCSTSCTIISGWSCPLAGTQCTPICGDKIVVGDEQCDEGPTAVACCTATCKLNPGFVCDPSKSPHSQPAANYCGDGIVDGPSNPSSPVRGNEQCDDHNLVPYDGCSPTCTNEPLCGTVNTSLPAAQQTSVPFQCFATCGDGIILPPEECDDGNVQDGDGCDSNCKVEKNPTTNQPAWNCVQGAAPVVTSIPVVWRDFSPRTHGQFEIDPQVGRRMPGITQNTLNRVSITGGSRPYKYVPAYNTAFKSPTWGTPTSTQNVANWTMNAPGWAGPCTSAACDVTLTAASAAKYTTAQMTSAFGQWYVDDSTVNITFASTLPLKTLSTGALQYTCNSTSCDNATTFGTTDGFFPLDGKGWVQQGKETSHTAITANLQHNFHFTTEARFWFTYQGGENLTFFGDDDVWVFVNGTLALDIGGIHGQTNGQFTLDSTTGIATSCAQDLADGSAGDTPCTTINLGLTKGQVYEVAVFNAERHVTGSNFQLTIKGFNNQPSVCTPICGDGYVVGPEQCDRGTGNVPPSGNTYGMCTTSCQLGPYCGDDKVLNPPEICDNGLNIDAYSKTPPTALQCAPGCVTPAFCGDGITQKVDGEQCDDGANNSNSYGHCQTTCVLGARCGDGTINGSETCDDGANNGAASSACDATCHKKCGNGTVDSNEQCDDGANNGTATSNCDTTCQLKCGNGQLDAGEQCDDGKNDGSYGTCNANCTFAPYCGDSVVQNPPEGCDNGAANSPTAYGPNSCTDQCLPGGFCGDGLINGTEKCDDGQNTGLPGSCKKDCSAYIPTTTCGDGIIQAGEKCDDGAKNGTSGDPCDKQCLPTCGNGVVDPGEQCDNGVNDGSYGTCTSACKLAGYCGDGIKNGNEQCDNGANNQVPGSAKAYGAGVCTTACLAAPFCGDGRVQTQYGEDCEGNDLCNPVTCKSTVPK